MKNRHPIDFKNCRAYIVGHVERDAAQIRGLGRRPDAIGAGYPFADEGF